MSPEFSRIKRLPPYVFNITNELKMAARRRGRGHHRPVAWATPTARRRGTSSTSWSRRRSARTPTATRSPRASRACAAPSATGTSAATTSISTRRREAIVTIGSKEGLAHLMLATLDRGDTVLVPNPSYPIHIYGAIIAGADIRSVRMAPGVDFFAELRAGHPGAHPQAQDADHRLSRRTRPRSASSSTSSRGWSRSRSSTASWSCTTSPTPTSPSTARRRRRSCRCRARATSRWSSSPCRRATTWPAGASASWSATRTWCTRWRASRATTTTAPSRPIQVAAIAALEGPQDCVRGDPPQVPEPPRRAGARACTRRAGWSRTRRPRCTSGRRSPSAYAAMGSLEFAKKLLRGRQGRGLPGHRLRRLRRRPRALRADRERERARARRCAASRRCSARTGLA